MPTFDQIVHTKAIEIGKLAVRATTAAGSGHPTSALSLAHIVTVLMYHTMRWDPEHPHHHGSDRLVLSEGHAVPIVYAACADIGVTFYPGGKAKIMNVDDLMTLRDIKSPIDGHPNPQAGFPFFDAATGSLGQGLSAAGGLGAAAKVDHHGKMIYCLIGDGEAREGQVWEAMDFIAEHKLTNVIAIFNCNEIAQSDYVAPAQTADHLQAKAEAFGWKAVIIDGHSPSDLVLALKLRTEAMVAGRPLAIIAKTVKGWGAPSLHGLGHHGVPVPELHLAKVLAELEQTGSDLGTGKVKPEDIKRLLRIHPPLHAPAHHAGHKAMNFLAAAEKHKLLEAAPEKMKMSPRRAYGLALDALGASNPNVVGLDADVKNSTYAQDFAKNHHARFFECRIAEQNMVSVGAGLAAGGKIPFMSTFAKFFSRACDQIEMALIGGANLKMVGTHAGITLAADGPSQMSLVDVPFFRALAHVKDHRGNPAVTVLTPSDAVSAYNMVLEMAEWPSACYLRALRADVPVLYPETETFPFGKFKVLRKATGGGGKGKKITLVAVGYMIHTILKALPQFEAAGLDVTLVDAYCLPFDTEALLKLAEGGPILSVEDNFLGGVASEIAEAIARAGKGHADALYVRNIPKSGKTPEDLLAYCHLSEADILAKAKALVG